MATRTDVSPRKTRDRILDAAASVLARRGYHGTNVEEVVTRSKTSKGGFYFHFASKERMVVALVDQLSQRLVNKVDRSINHEARPNYRLAMALSTLMHTLGGRRKLSQVLLTSVMGHGKSLDRKFLPVRDRFAGLIQRELDGAVAAGLTAPLDTALASRMWLGALHEVILQWLIAEAPPPLTTVVPAVGRMLFQSASIPAAQFPEEVGSS